MLKFGLVGALAVKLRLGSHLGVLAFLGLANVRTIGLVGGSGTTVDAGLAGCLSGLDSHLGGDPIGRNVGVSVGSDRLAFGTGGGSRDEVANTAVLANDTTNVLSRLRGGRFGFGKGSRRHTISAAGQRDPRLLEEGLVLGTVEAGLGRKVRRVGTDRILCQRILVLCKVLASGPGGGPVPSGDAGRMDRNVDLCNHGRSRQRLQYNNQ